jgi:hypothetical protein
MAGVLRVDLRIVDVIDRTQEDVPVFVGEVGPEHEPVRAEGVDRAPQGGDVPVPDGVVPHPARRAVSGRDAAAVRSNGSIS